MWMRLEEEDEGLFLGMAIGVLALGERGAWFNVW
jgi:hypothetical protein